MMIRKFMTATVATLAFSPTVYAKEGNFFADAEISAGQDVVPADIIENGIDQDRIETVVGGKLRLGYDFGGFMVEMGSEVTVFPEDSRFNRYAIGPGVRTDIPLADNGRTRLRLGAEYRFVQGEDGRVFDRPRVDAQLIHRHSREHATTARLRYGFRNQTEDRFTGFDQSEWLAELRHNWRPGGGRTSINASLLGLKHDADADRFSYDGYGLRLTGRTPLAENLDGRARFSIVQRDYKAPFSQQYPVNRSDTHVRAEAGLEYHMRDNVSLFANAGYVSNSSNIPVRDYDGFIGRLGLRFSLAGD